MASASRRQKKRDHPISALEADIQALSLAEDGCRIPPAKAAFGSVGALLTTIRVRSPHPATYFRLTFTQDSPADDEDYIGLGSSCGAICKALDRGLNGRQPEDLGPSVFEAIEELTG